MSASSTSSVNTSLVLLSASRPSGAPAAASPAPASTASSARAFRPAPGGDRSGMHGRGRHNSKPKVKLSAPRPVNLPSLKKENLGLDPSVSLIPSGSSGWGNSSASSSVSAASDGREATLHSSSRQLRPAWNNSGSKPPAQTSTTASMQDGRHFPKLGQFEPATLYEGGRSISGSHHNRPQSFGHSFSERQSCAGEMHSRGRRLNDSSDWSRKTSASDGDWRAELKAEPVPRVVLAAPKPATKPSTSEAASSGAAPGPLGMPPSDTGNPGWNDMESDEEMDFSKPVFFESSAVPGGSSTTPLETSAPSSSHQGENEQDDSARAIPKGNAAAPSLYASPPIADAPVAAAASVQVKKPVQRPEAAERTAGSVPVARPDSAVSSVSLRQVQKPVQASDSTMKAAASASAAQQANGQLDDEDQEAYMRQAAAQAAKRRQEEEERLQESKRKAAEKLRELEERIHRRKMEAQKVKQPLRSRERDIGSAFQRRPIRIERRAVESNSAVADHPQESSLSQIETSSDSHPARPAPVMIMKRPQSESHSAERSEPSSSHLSSEQIAATHPKQESSSLESMSTAQRTNNRDRASKGRSKKLVRVPESASTAEQAKVLSRPDKSKHAASEKAPKKISGRRSKHPKKQQTEISSASPSIDLHGNKKNQVDQSIVERPRSLKNRGKPFSKHSQNMQHAKEELKGESGSAVVSGNERSHQKPSSDELADNEHKDAADSADIAHDRNSDPFVEVKSRRVIREEKNARRREQRQQKQAMQRKERKFAKKAAQAPVQTSPESSKDGTNAAPVNETSVSLSSKASVSAPQQAVQPQQRRRSVPAWKNAALTAEVVSKASHEQLPTPDAQSTQVTPPNVKSEGDNAVQAERQKSRGPSLISSSAQVDSATVLSFERSTSLSSRSPVFVPQHIQHPIPGHDMQFIMGFGSALQSMTQMPQTSLVPNNPYGPQPLQHVVPATMSLNDYSMAPSVWQPRSAFQSNAVLLSRMGLPMRSPLLSSEKNAALLRSLQDGTCLRKSLSTPAVSANSSIPQSQTVQPAIESVQESVPAPASASASVNVVSTSDPSRPGAASSASPEQGSQRQQRRSSGRGKAERGRMRRPASQRHVVKPSEETADKAEAEPSSTEPSSHPKAIADSHSRPNFRSLRRRGGFSRRGGRGGARHNSRTSPSVAEVQTTGSTAAQVPGSAEAPADHAAATAAAAAAPSAMRGRRRRGGNTAGSGRQLSTATTAVSQGSSSKTRGSNRRRNKTKPLPEKDSGSSPS